MKIKRREFLTLSGLGSILTLTKLKKDMRKTTRCEAKHSSLDGWIELIEENVTWNLKKIREYCKVPVMAVVKANAYGHGLKEIASILEKLRIDYLMVGKLQEALSLRKKGITSRINNFGPFAAEEAHEIVQNEITQSISSEEVITLNQAALKASKKAKINIHLDTGMSRMGIPYYEALPLIQKISSLSGLEVVGISTTLTEDPDFDKEQLERFLKVCQEAESQGITMGVRHVASSSGILTLKYSHLDMVRPGILLYGYYPSDETQKEDRLNLRPVLQFKARVVAVKHLRPGDSISYHRVYRVKKKEKIAIIPVGYSDGYPQNVAGKASVLIGGKRFPVIASVTANHMPVLLDDDSSVKVGDEVVLLGLQGEEKILADELASWSGVSTYKILISLNPLLPRIVV